ncbi:hypothetical protein Pcinc_031630 [Petrolisthes cinctipes]|uniref:C-type lectin domain-containing protein n=1 Tax=Petrolisthes cinctipes TaxID=88211 RepID=A0AAE1EVT1_PETCI|nr:hypothetical protein Pcinc_031630 [Petrolisthes cinctipes]
MKMGLSLNGTLILGQEQDLLAGDFAYSQVLHGDISQVNIWDRELGPSEVLLLAACTSNMRGNVFAMDGGQGVEETVKLVGKVSVAVVPLQQLCQSDPHYLILPERRSVPASLTQCRLLHAPLTVPTSQRDNTRLQRALQPFASTCSSTPWKLWLGASDESQEGVWKSLDTGRVLNYNNFVPPFPYGGLLDNCVALFTDGTWGDAKCSDKKCSVCEILPSKFLRLRGLCFEDEHETRFRASGGYLDGRPVFRGFYDLLIAWNKTTSQWVLSNINNNTLAITSPSDLVEYPLGLRRWVVVSLLCGAHPGDTLQLSLSPCSTRHHFMCRSGECVTRRHRCNMRYECSDGSDEENCHVINLQGGYSSHLTPPGNGMINSASVQNMGPIAKQPSNQDDEINGWDIKKDPLMIIPSMTILRILSIDETDFSVTAEVRVKLRWVDSRLSFSHLADEGGKAGRRGTALMREDLGKIWVPEYRLYELRGARSEVLKESVTVASANNPTLPNINDVKMDVAYPGRENPLTLTRDHLATFTCSSYHHHHHHHQYHFTYPFSTHRCPITLRLASTYKGFVRFDKHNQRVKFAGVHELLGYSVLGFGLKDTDGEEERKKQLEKTKPMEEGKGQHLEEKEEEDVEEEMTAILEVQCHVNGLVLSFFAPTILLVGISWATFFIGWEALLTRAVLSLGLMFLLFHLRLSLSTSTVPPSPSVRLIDVWYFVYIVIMSVNILVHILVPQLPSSSSSPRDPSPVPKVKTLFVRPAGGVNGGVVIGRESHEKEKKVRPSTTTHPRLILAYRNVLLPSVVIIFNVVFWLLLMVR